jgi:carbon monoxide dehydrogenase subunit G
MTEIVRETVTIPGSQAAVWSIIEDPGALERVLPGAESIVATGPGQFRGVLATKIQFLTVRADVTASFHDADRPRHLRLQIDGRPRGLAGSFSVSVPFDMAPADGPAGPESATEVSYAVDLQVTGRLATFGTPLLRDTLRRQIAALVGNLGRELAGSQDRPRDP